MNENFGHILVALIFIGLISAPTVKMLLREDVEKRAIEQFERRRLTPFPDLPHNRRSLRNYPKKFDDAFSDNFGFRLPLVQIMSRTYYDLFGNALRSSLIAGEDGWFFTGRSDQGGKREEEKFDGYASFDRTHQLSEDLKKQWKTVLEERKSYLDKLGVQYLFVVAPNKSDIYPENLPPYLSKRRVESVAEQLVNYLETNSSVHVVDLFQLLRNKKESASYPLYFKTDGHWNQIGAFYAYQEVMRKANEVLPEKTIQPLELSQFDIIPKPNWSHDGFRAQLGFSVKEPFYRLAPVRAPEMRDLLRIGLEGNSRSKKVTGDFPLKDLLTEKENRPLIKIRDSYGREQPYKYSYNYGDNELDRVLLLSDSYLLKAFRYFGVHTKELFRSRTQLNFTTHFFHIEDDRIDLPDIVIQSVSARYIRNEPPTNPKEMK